MPRSRSKSPVTSKKKKGKANQKNSVPSINVEDVEDLVEVLRANYENGINKSYEARIRNLESLRTLLVKGREKLCKWNRI